MDGMEPTTKAFLEKLAQQKGPQLYELSPADARKILLKVQADTLNKSDIRQDVSIEDIMIPGGKVGEISLRIVRPKQAKGPLPVIMYFHGGGWVMGDKETHDRLIRLLATGAHAAVVFVNFTQAPEGKYPLQIEQAYEATNYIASHGKELNLDSSKIVVAGDSVGGNMAIAVTLMAKERKSPKILYQILFYPVTDANFDTCTYQKFATGLWLTKKAMEWFWDNYLPDKSKRKEPTACPLQASREQLKGLPPALIINGEFDVLRGEGQDYAHKLIDAGVPVTAIRILGTIHDFMLINALSHTPAPENALALALNHLNKVFNQNSPA